MMILDSGLLFGPPCMKCNVTKTIRTAINPLTLSACQSMQSWSLLCHSLSEPGENL